MKVGFASKVISPDYENQKVPLQLAGYSPRELCSGIHDDIYARFKQLDFVEWQYTGDAAGMFGDAVHSGLTTQKLAEQFPELVKTDFTQQNRRTAEEPEPFVTGDEYSLSGYVLVTGITAQKTQVLVDDLQAAYDVLASEYDALSAQYDALAAFVGYPPVI